MFASVCAIFLFVPFIYLRYFGLDVWAIHLRPYFAVGFFVSAFLLGGKTGQYVHRATVSHWLYKRRILQYLETELSADEVLVLQKYAESGRKTQYFDPASGAVNNLAGNGILYTPSRQYNVLKGCAYTLTRAAAPYVLDRERFQKMILATPDAKRRLKISN